MTIMNEWMNEWMSIGRLVINAGLTLGKVNMEYDYEYTLGEVKSM